MLPPRTLDTMVEAISLTSPSGRMSKRARKAATERLRVALFGPEGLQLPKPPQPTRKEYLLQRAKLLRDMANGRKKYLRIAAECEAEAAKL